MHLAAQFLVSWALAFVELSAALVLLNHFYYYINQGLALRSPRQEAAIAGVSSLVLGASAWVIASFLGGQVRAMFGAELVVAFIYRVSHFRDWGRYEVILLLVFYSVLGCAGGLLWVGLVRPAMLLLILFGGILAVIAYFIRSL
jgi:hypothetical protein